MPTVRVTTKTAGDGPDDADEVSDDPCDADDGRRGRPMMGSQASWLRLPQKGGFYRRVHQLSQPISVMGSHRTFALAGDIPASRAACERFFTLWKDADPEVPILVEARREYGRLPSATHTR